MIGQHRSHGRRSTATTGFEITTALAVTVTMLAAVAPIAAEVVVKGEFDLSPAGGNGIAAKRMAFGNGRLWISDWGNHRITAADNAGNVIWSVEVGSWPYGLAVDETNVRVFVANYGDDTVTVVDAADWNIHGPPIAVGDGPIEVAVNQTTNRVYVANQGTVSGPDNTVTVIDADTLDVIATVPVSNYPDAIAIDEVSNQIYVAFLYESHVAVIDGVTHAVSTFPVLSDRIRGIAIDRDNDRMYLCDRGFDRLGVYVYSTKALLTTIAVGYQPSRLRPYLDDDLLYVVTNGAVDIVDLTSGTVTDTLPVGTDIHPEDVYRVPQWDFLFVANANSTLHAYYPDSLTLWHRQPLARFPRAVAADGTIGRAYAATWNYGEPEGSVWAMGFSPVGFRQRIPVAENPLVMAVNPVDDRIYVGHGGDVPTITVINSATNQVATTLAAYASDFALDPVANRIYFAHGAGDNYGIIDGYTPTVLYYVTMPWGGVGRLGIDPVLDRGYVYASFGGGRFAVIDPATGAIYDQQTIGGGDIEVDVARHLVYMADYNGRQVHVINGSTGAIVTSVPVNLFPGSLALDATNRLLYAVGHDSENVEIIDTAANTVTQSLAIGPELRDVATDGVSGFAYVAMEDEGKVVVLGAPEIFSDGFESGDTSAWSSATP